MPPPIATMRGPRPRRRNAWMTSTTLPCSLPGQERAEHRLRELQVAEDQQADTEDAEDHRARPVGQELQRDVVELVRAAWRSGRSPSGRTRHRARARARTAMSSSSQRLICKTRREPAQPARRRLKPCGHLPRLHQRFQNVQGYSGTTLHLQYGDFTSDPSSGAACGVRPRRGRGRDRAGEAGT